MNVQIDKTRSVLSATSTFLMSLVGIAMGVFIMIYSITSLESSFAISILILMAFILIADATLEITGTAICLIYDWNTTIEVDQNTESVRYHNKWISGMEFSLNEIEQRTDYDTPPSFRYALTDYAILQLKDGRTILLGMYLKNAEQRGNIRLRGCNTDKTQSSIFYKELFQYILNLFHNRRQTE